MNPSGVGSPPSSSPARRPRCPRRACSWRGSTPDTSPSASAPGIARPLMLVSVGRRATTSSPTPSTSSSSPSAEVVHAQRLWKSGAPSPSPRSSLRSGASALRRAAGTGEPGASGTAFTPKRVLPASAGERSRNAGEARHRHDRHPRQLILGHPLIAGELLTADHLHDRRRRRPQHLPARSLDVVALLRLVVRSTEIGHAAQIRGPVPPSFVAIVEFPSRV